MEALYLLVPLSVMLVALAVWIFFGAAESGQFDDLEGPGMRILVDDDRGDALGASAQGRAGRVGGSENAG
ncbi:cbb3-type cytochrome oxidase assembly protein CcoS [Massilia sp. MS-15]|uniref:cbb3-type cytochrome oxidase assembly protein CcoS n=1 Tax=Massilia sp. MS-15 TaxID=2878200 RepID=UPI001CD5C7C7|nr:cbb3-type cytochrome oxidase assembly protein CcoS [Massilia sp. MS-15]MCA1247983.1 cbb3-type cytochrome oxidase assembly protein CcoS [Massilia sp. MS-15]